jgi:hypothetical protein
LGCTGLFLQLSYLVMLSDFKVAIALSPVAVGNPDWVQLTEPTMFVVGKADGKQRIFYFHLHGRRSLLRRPGFTPVYRTAQSNKVFNRDLKMGQSSSI